MRSSLDGRPVIVHDAFVRRGLKRQKVSSLPAAALRLPLLEDVLAEFAGAWLDVELKVAGLEARVLELVARYLIPGRFVITSFLPQVLEEIKRLSPQTPVGLLVRRPSARWQQMNLDFLAPHYTLMTNRLCQDARSRGLRLIAWTVNSPAAMRRVRRFGVDVVITDYPERFLAGR